MNKQSTPQTQLDNIKKEFECKGDLIFMCALQELIKNGAEAYSESEVMEVKGEIEKQDDSKSFMSNDFQIAILECTAELAKIQPIEILRYVFRRKIYIGG